MDKDRQTRIASAFSLASIALRVAELEQTAIVVKEDGKWCVKSEKNPDWNGGCYKTKAEAEARLKQVEMFKHMGSSKLAKEKSEYDELYSKVLEFDDKLDKEWQAHGHSDEFESMLQEQEKLIDELNKLKGI
jgi:hypothetical protein